MIDAFYSDPHFYHQLLAEHRGFSTADEMNRVLVERYNSAVKPGQTTLWLGDCFFGPFEQAKETLRHLNGNKILCRGNHDRSASRMAAMGFDLVAETMILDIAGHPVEASHYPYADGALDARVFEFPLRKKGWALIHGHIHGPKIRRGNMVHVGVDAWGLSPVSMQTVTELVTAAFNCRQG